MSGAIFYYWYLPRGTVPFSAPDGARTPTTPTMSGENALQWRGETLQWRSEDVTWR